jgi:tetratricopeptide (TPR) repeat protein
MVEWMRRNLKAAIEAAERQHVFAEQLGDSNLIANALTGILAPAWYGDASFSEIRPNLQRQLEWARSVGQRALEGSLTFVLGKIHTEQGRVEEGKPLIEEGLGIVEDLGLVIHRAGLRAQFTEGDLARNPDEVEKNVRETCELMRSLNETASLSTLAAQLAMIVARRGDLHEAEGLIRESERLGSSDDVTTQAEWRSARARVLTRRGSLEDAEALAWEALAVAMSTEYRELQAEAHLALGEALAARGKTDEAMRETASALDIFERKEWASTGAVRAQLAELQSSGSPSQ